MIRSTSPTLVGIWLFAAVLMGAAAGQARRPALNMERAPDPLSGDHGRIEKPLSSTATADTTILGAWDFDNGGLCTDDGWVSVDATAQQEIFFHVDDFAGLGGGDFGRLYALEGNQSMWCGARPDANDYYRCQYAVLPGYGNRWNQVFGTADCLSVQGDVAFDFLAAWDSEPGYDATCVQFDECDDNWIGFNLGFAYYSKCDLDAWGFDRFYLVVPDTALAGSVRFRFQFTSDGAWSDYDGFWDTDGAVILDSLTVSDATGTVLSTETFESEAVGAHATLSGNWEASVPPGYGDFAGLFSGTELLQEGACNVNNTCMWAFINGSTADYSCGGHPEQAVVPFGNSEGQYISNEIWSPFVPIVGVGTVFHLATDVYEDLPLDNLIYYQWHVRFLVDGCPTRWRNTNNNQFGANGWSHRVFDFSHLYEDEPAATEMQVSLGVVDLCAFYCGSVGSGACHSHSPLFDNVEVRRLEITSPTWYVQRDDLFQDNFPADGTTTGTVRADMADDLLPAMNPAIRPGDSCAVTVTFPGDGIATDPHTGMGPAVYAYVSVWPQGQPGKTGTALSGDPSRWPDVDTIIHGGVAWTCLRMDTSYSFAGPQPDRYCVDLNDNLFTPGDTVCFVFSATSGAPSSATSYWTEFVGETTSLSLALDNAMEFTCLPTAAVGPGTRILYVDAADGYGAQPAFDAAFAALGLSANVDRYDQRAPDFSAHNGLASRVSDPVHQVARIYDIIVWSSGITPEPLGDGVNGKSDDASLLATFMDERCAGGIYFTGDDIAMAISQASPPGGPALRAYIDFTLDGGDHVSLGHDLSPLVAAAPGSCFDRVPDDTLIAYGGCPTLRDFDVITPGAGAALEASYLSGALSGGAIVSQQEYNPNCAWTGPPQKHGVVLAGFGFETIQNDRPSAPTDAVAHMDDVLSWLRDTPTGIESGNAPRNALAQNYPNPFNPATTITFQIRRRAPVTLRIYNVAGQRVRTLVDESSVAPGIVHTAEWDGLNDRGQRVASGVYFYRLDTTGYTRTRKMVLLK